MGLADDLRSLREQWPMARRYRYRGDLLALTASAVLERFWWCRVRRRHRVKFSSAGHCVCCGRRVVA